MDKTSFSFIRTNIQKNYNLPRRFKLQLLRESPDNYVFLVKNSRGGKTLVVRVNKRNVGGDVLFEITWLKELKSRNIPVPEIISTQKGQDFLIDKRGQVYVAFEYLEGRHLEIKPDFKPRLDLVRKAAMILAELHNASLGVNLDMSRGRTILTEINRALQIKNELIEYSEGGDKFVEELTFYRRWAEENGNNNYLIHNDFRAGNVFYEGNRVSAILDFDWSCRGPAIKDVAHALAEWSFPDGAKKHWRDVFDAFLKSYNRKAKNKIRLDNRLYRWICFSCLSDTATYLADLAREDVYKKITDSYMYQKFLYFERFIK